MVWGGVASHIVLSTHPNPFVGVGVVGVVGSVLFSENRTGTRETLFVTRSKQVCVQAARPISTSQLHTLRCFHFWPINPVV